MVKSDNIDNRSNEELEHAIALAQHTVYKRYLTELERYPLIEPSPVLLDESPEKCIRLLQLEEFTCKAGEDIFQTLSTVYHASMSLGCDLVIMVDVKSVKSTAKFYIGVHNGEENKQALQPSFKTLKNGIKSNFPGTRFSEIPAKTKLPGVLNNIFYGEGAAKFISSVSCVASIRDKSETGDKSFIQGLERFVDAMQGHAYTAIFIAEPICREDQAAIRSGYESLYSVLSSFQKSTWSYSENDSTSVMESLSKGVSTAITDGTSHTQAHTVNFGMNVGLNSGRTNSNSNSYTETHSDTRPHKAILAGRVVSSVANVVGLVGKAATFVNPVVGLPILAVSGVTSKASSVVQGVMEGMSHTDSVSNAITDTIGKSLGISGGVNTGIARTSADATLHNETESLSKTKTRGTTETKGTGRTLQIENDNKSIQEMMKRIEEQLERIQEGEAYGSYNCGAYFLSGREDSSILAANIYRALMLGKDSSVESGAINLWKEQAEPEKMKTIKQYLSKFVHPVFAISVPESENISRLITYTSGTIVSGLELPLHMGLPTKSVYGLPVLEHAEFGRNVTYKDRIGNYYEDGLGIKIGNIYHMGQMEKEASVDLDIQRLASHTFVTGSTGAGKSNTIYTLLQKLEKENVKFLVVEPAKGEYKTALGNREDVMVYGTNPK